MFDTLLSHPESHTRRHQNWTQTYKIRADRLIADELMLPAGLTVIDAVKAAGLWDVTDDVDLILIPNDLKTALQSLPFAFDNFSGFSPSSRRNTLRWIKTAKHL